MGSVFRSLIDDGQYEDAHALASRHSASFPNPWEHAWAEVARAHVETDPEKMQDAFEKAAHGFGQNTSPEPEDLQKRGGSWQSIDIDVWGPYYRARAELVGATIDPVRAIEYLRRASDHLEGFVSGSGWHVPVVCKTAIAVKGLLGFMETKNLVTLEVSQSEIEKEIALWGEDRHDPIVVGAFEKIRHAFLETEKDAKKAFEDGLLIDALNMLDAAPIASPAIALKAALRPIRSAAFEKLQETKEERRLKAIQLIEAMPEEDAFRKFIKECIQGLHSTHAKITHGPIERGRDIIALLKDGPKEWIWMIQAKTGQIAKADLRDLKDQIEAMFQTPIADPHIPNEAAVLKRGAVMHTDPTTTHIDAEFLGWLDGQRDAHGWDIEIWGPEKVVEWILENGLDGILRSFPLRHGIRPKT